MARTTHDQLVSFSAMILPLSVTTNQAVVTWWKITQAVSNLAPHMCEGRYAVIPGTQASSLESRRKNTLNFS